ncbi:MAG: sulfite exporter TauE/SafE family protein, partial [Phycisphaerae bacterium]|nr:sulfite exporter TauE/SafE family protein [Phycisphaerae bacterium]
MVWWAVVCFAVFGIGVTKSGFGSGVGLMLVPTMALAMGHIPGRGSEAALGLMLPLLVCGDLLAVWQYRSLFSLSVVKRLFPGTAVGLVFGAILLWYLKHAGSERLAEALIQCEIGIESVMLVGLHWYRLMRRKVQRLMREPARSNLTGMFAAASSTLAHGAGPIIALYLLPLEMNRQLYVGTCAIYFFILNAAKLPIYGTTGQFGHASPL